MAVLPPFLRSLLHVLLGVLIRSHLPWGAILLGGLVLAAFAVWFRSQRGRLGRGPSLQPLPSRVPEGQPVRAPPGVSVSWDESARPEAEFVEYPLQALAEDELLPPPFPSLPPSPTGGFGWKLLGLFIAFAVPLLLFSEAFFREWNRLVAVFGEILWYPKQWSFGTFWAPANDTDLILLMYLSAFGSYTVAILLARRKQFAGNVGSRAAGIFGLYVFFALISDVLLVATPNEAFVFSLLLLGRALLGGLFLVLFVLTIIVVPPPLFVAPTLPRTRGFLAVWWLSVLAALLLAFGVLVLFYRFLGLGQGLFPFAILLLLPIYAYLIWIGFGRYAAYRELRQRPLPSFQEYHPSVSIVIPAYNEEAGIIQAIRSADTAAASYPGPVEILVGNDGSTDRTSELAHRAMNQLKHAGGEVLDLVHGGKAHALNSLLKAARGVVLIRADGDSHIDESAGFASLVPHFADPEVGGVQGRILPLQSHGWTRKLRSMELAWNHFFQRPALMAMRSPQVIDGAFCAFRRKDLLDVGGWVDWNGEDTEITLRLCRMGYRFRFEPNAALLEDVPATYRGLKRQRIRWSRGGLFAHMRHIGAIFSDAPEYGGLALLVWLFLFVRGGMRYLVFAYALLATTLLGLPTLFHLGLIVLLLFIPRAAIIGGYLIRTGRSKAVGWVAMWPGTGAVKQFFVVESYATVLPGAIREFSE